MNIKVVDSEAKRINLATWRHVGLGKVLKPRKCRHHHHDPHAAAAWSSASVHTNCTIVLLHRLLTFKNCSPPQGGSDGKYRKYRARRSDLIIYHDIAVRDVTAQSQIKTFISNTLLFSSLQRIAAHAISSLTLMFLERLDSLKKKKSSNNRSGESFQEFN